MVLPYEEAGPEAFDCPMPDAEGDETRLKSKPKPANALPSSLSSLEMPDLE